MKFEEIYIDGFGMFNDYHIKDLNPGLTIFIGPNETGKSTILSFQKRILFGFPKKRGKLNLYPPLFGGNHGGRLIVSTDEHKRYTIERYANRGGDVNIILPDGSKGEPSDLSSLLGLVNKDIFENIYAFGLTELQDFETLNSEDIKEKIYSAGAGIGAVSLSKVQKSLETGAGNIFKERGSKPEINALFTEIRNMDSKLSDMKKYAQNFDVLHKELEEITEKIQITERERILTRTDSNHTENLITAWDDWKKIKEAKEALEKIPKIESFPGNGVGLLEKNVEKIDELGELISEKNDELERILIKKSQIKIDEKLLFKRGEIIDLQKGEEHYKSAIGDLPGLEEKIKRDGDRLKESLREIGANWDEEKLSGFDISIPAKEIVRKQHQEIEDTQKALYDTKTEEKVIKKEYDRITGEIEKIGADIEKWASSELSESELNQKRECLKKLRAGYPDLKKLQTEKERIVKGIEKLKGEIREVKGNIGDNDSPMINEKCQIQQKNALSKLRGRYPLLKELEVKRGGIEKEINGIKKGLEGIERKIKKLDTSKSDEKDLTQKRESLQKLRTKTVQLEKLKMEISNLEEKEDLFTILGTKETSTAQKLPPWALILLIISGAFWAGFLILSILKGDPIASIGISALLATSLIIYTILRKRGTQNETKDKGSPELTKKADALSEKKSELKQKLDGTINEITHHTKILGFNEIPEPALIEDKYSKIQGAFTNLKYAEELKEQQESLSKDLTELNKESGLVGNELESLRDEMLSNARILGFGEIPWPELIEEKDKGLQVAFINLKKIEELTQNEKTINMELDLVEKDLESLRDEMLLNARILGFDEIFDPKLIEDKDSELQAAFTNLQKTKELKEDQDKLFKYIKKIEKELDTVKNNLLALSEDKEQAQKKWKEWLIEKGLNCELTPEGAIDIFSTIKTCIEKKKSIEGDLIPRTKRVKGSIYDYEARISSVLKYCNRQKDGINILLELEKFTEELKLALEGKNTLIQLGKDEEDLKRNIKKSEEKLKNHRKILTDLLSSGFSESEDEFKKKAKNWDDINTLKNDILSSEQNIKRIGDDKKLYLDIIDELEKTTPEDLKEKELQLKERFEEIEKNLSDLREKRGGITKEIEQIKQHKESSSLRIEKAVKMQKLNKKSEEWAILILARTIMKKAVENYELERQPGVIKEAQSFFSKMTCGRYFRIFAPLDEKKIYVEDKDKRRKDVWDLSRGTAEQLYLSLRFGFIREFSKRAESLPIIFDDILVNFDPDRFKAACQAIKELTETNQVLYFSCHPENVEMMVGIIPDSKVIHLYRNI